MGRLLRFPRERCRPPAGHSRVLDWSWHVGSLGRRVTLKLDCGHVLTVSARDKASGSVRCPACARRLARRGDRGA